MTFEEHLKDKILTEMDDYPPNGYGDLVDLLVDKGLISPFSEEAWGAAATFCQALLRIVEMAMRRGLLDIEGTAEWFDVDLEEAKAEFEDWYGEEENDD